MIIYDLHYCYCSYLRWIIECYYFRKKNSRSKDSLSRGKPQKMLDDADKAVEAKKKETILEAKERSSSHPFD